MELAPTNGCDFSAAVFGRGLTGHVPSAAASRLTKQWGDWDFEQTWEEGVPIMKASGDKIRQHAL